MSSAPSANAPESLLVVRLGAMGDVIHTLYAVSALRSAFPDMRIGWAIEERWTELLAGNSADRCGPRSPLRPVVDRVHPLNTKQWRRSLLSRTTWNELKTGFRGMREQNYVVAADFQGAIKSALVSQYAGAKLTVGMENAREGPARIFYSRRISTKGTHVIQQYHSLAEAIARTMLTPAKPVFPRDERAEQSIADKLGESARNLVILNPGAGWGAKQWPAERFGHVAKALAHDGMIPVINSSPAEQDLALTVQRDSDGRAVPISCTIGELIALTRRASLCIGGDTGPMHLAAALGVPVVALFGPTDPARNRPYGTHSVVLRNPASRTSLSHTGVPDPGLRQITSDEVIAVARRVLESSHG
ncbi:MAG TPA: glycosyltransferase family 9 protein [Terriglobales bacterium]